MYYAHQSTMLKPRVRVGNIPHIRVYEAELRIGDFLHIYSLRKLVAFLKGLVDALIVDNREDNAMNQPRSLHMVLHLSGLPILLSSPCLSSKFRKTTMKLISAPTVQYRKDSIIYPRSTKQDKET